MTCNCSTFINAIHKRQNHFLAISVIILTIIILNVRHRKIAFTSRTNSESSSPERPVHDDTTQLALINTSVRYVSVCPAAFDTRRTGNQMFNLAAMLHVAHLTNRPVAMVKNHPHGWLDRIFEVLVVRVDSIERELCPCTVIRETKSLAYEQSMTSLPYQKEITGKSILICGYTQSWRYTLGVESQLRRLLRPKNVHSSVARSFLNASKPARWTEISMPVTRVAIHVRAGDVMNSHALSHGYTIPKRPFFERAMANVTGDAKIASTHDASNDTIRRYQFFVLSDSIAWVLSSLGLSAIGADLKSASVDVEVTFSVNTAAVDLILMTMCDVVIMTTGTYGWWGAWLANAKKTIYYRNWPRPESPLSKSIVREDFFPPNWISFDGPFHDQFS